MLASKRAKKFTRLAFSVQRSTRFNPHSCFPKAQIIAQTRCKISALVCFWPTTKDYSPAILNSIYREISAPRHAQGEDTRDQNGGPPRNRPAGAGVGPGWRHRWTSAGLLHRPAPGRRTGTLPSQFHYRTL